MKRWLALAGFAACTGGQGAQACTVPVVRTEQRAAAEADVVVQGTARFPKQAGEGELRVVRMLKGRVPETVTITGREGWPVTAPICDPLVRLKGTRQGTFYLVRLKSGRFDILLFQEGS